MRLRRSTVVPFVLLLGAAAVACGDDDDDIAVPNSDTADSGSGDGSTASATPSILTSTLAPLVAGAAAPSLQLAASGAAPIAWAVTTGALPAGIALSADGIYSGTPVAAGSSTFTVTATNAAGSGTKTFTQLVTAPLSDAFVLTDTNQISRFAKSFPAGASTPTAIANVAPGFTLVSIDRRPQNGYLYGIAFNPTTKAIALYAIHPSSGFAIPVGTTGVFDSDIAGTTFGVDFNPSVDRVRIVTAAGHNFRMNPNNGALVDFDMGAGGVQRDGAINGAVTVSAAETAYTNSVANNGAITTQYTISGSSLYIQNPPNDGTLTLPKALANVESVFGFDIPPGVNAVANNAAVTAGLGYAALKLAGAETSQLASINLVDGQLGVLGSFPFTGIRGLALDASSTRPVIALSANGEQLLRFSEAAPATVTTVNVTGVDLLERLVGIDFRPATGQLYALGVNALANSATLYLIDPQGGQAAPVGPTGGIAFQTVTGEAIDLPLPAVGYGLNFNPTVDRLRVVTSTGLNFRVNPNDGAPVDGDATGANVNTDGAITGGALTGVAYTNDAVAPGATGFTAEYAIDAASNAIHLVTNPNAGTLGAAIPVRLANAALDFTEVSGFDIAQSVVTTAANAAVTEGSAYAALTVGGATNLYRIDLVTGTATFVSAIGAGTVAITGLAVGR